MRLRKIKNATEKIKQFTNIVIFEPANYKGKWCELFKNDNPIYIEIGMGKGKFILENAKINPDINYIGIEIAESVILKAAQKINEFNLSNLYIINVDASNLDSYFEKNEISKIFLNFSDPWPKSRHEKRRLTSNIYLALYRDILIKDGIIELKSDNRKLFEYSIMKFNEKGYIFLDFSLDLHNQLNNYDHQIITTEYEEKFKSLGQVIYYIKVEVK